MLRWLGAVTSSLLLSTPGSALAQREYREAFPPYNLTCQLSGELGPQRLLFHVEDVQLKMLFLPTVTLEGKALDVQTFDRNEVKGSLAGGVPGLASSIESADFTLDRNTGTIAARYHGPWQTASTEVGSKPLRFRLDYAASGRCDKAPQVF